MNTENVKVIIAENSNGEVHRVFFTVFNAFNYARENKSLVFRLYTDTGYKSYSADELIETFLPSAKGRLLNITFYNEKENTIDGVFIHRNSLDFPLQRALRVTKDRPDEWIVYVMYADTTERFTYDEFRAKYPVKEEEKQEEKREAEYGETRADLFAAVRLLSQIEKLPLAYVDNKWLDQARHMIAKYKEFQC